MNRPVPDSATAAASVERYLRQMILPEVGQKGQAALSRAHVAVIGAGGLGAPVLQYLAGAGVGMLTVVDPDRVERGNLHRQILFAERDIGMRKAEAAAAFCTQLNGDIEAIPSAEALSSANARRLTQRTDVVLDCADSFEVSYVLSDLCLRQNKPLISASALGLSGYAGGFCGGAPSLRAVFPDLPETAMSCDAAGVLGPLTGLLGSLQAQMTLALLLGLTPSPLGQLIRFDTAGFRFSGFRFDGAAEPDHPFRFIDISEISKHDFVVDLRDEQEAPEVITPNARRHRVQEFGTETLHPADGRRAVLCCRTGLRSWQAANRLRRVWPGEIALVAARHK